MRIVQVNTSDLNGGAARAVYRVHSALRDAGYDAEMLVLQRQSRDASVLRFEPPMHFSQRLLRFARSRRLHLGFARYRKSRPQGYELFSNDRTQYRYELTKFFHSYDLVHLHWIARFIDYETFFASLPLRKPVLWTLHDMNAFTGGCHYDLGCGKYTAQCGACPQLGSDNKNDLSHVIWKRKQRIFRKLASDQLRIVALNQWMAHEILRNDLLRRFAVTIIPNGVDTNVFAPHDRAACRSALGIPQNARVILFIANEVMIRRKGFALLRQALDGVAGQIEHLVLLSAGEGKPRLATNLAHVHLGKIVDDHMLARVYAAADIFVIPSLQDNQPNTVLEAMACGIPVVGFANGGIAEMVRTGVNGSLVPTGAVRALREALLELLQHSEMRANFSNNCRRIALEEYTLALQARRYVTLYEEVCAASPRPALLHAA